MDGVSLAESLLYRDQEDIERYKNLCQHTKGQNIADKSLWSSFINESNSANNCICISEQNAQSLLHLSNVNVISISKQSLCEATSNLEKQTLLLRTECEKIKLQISTLPMDGTSLLSSENSIESFKISDLKNLVQCLHTIQCMAYDVLNRLQQRYLRPTPDSVKFSLENWISTGQHLANISRYLLDTGQVACDAINKTPTSNEDSLLIQEVARTVNELTRQTKRIRTALWSTLELCQGTVMREYNCNRDTMPQTSSTVIYPHPTVVSDAQSLTALQTTQTPYMQSMCKSCIFQLPSSDAFLTNKYKVKESSSQWQNLVPTGIMKQNHTSLLPGNLSQTASNQYIQPVTSYGNNWPSMQLRH